MIIYTVKRGETESDVAKRFNISTQTLMGDNGLVSRLSITEGQNLLIRESKGRFQTTDMNTQRGNHVKIEEATGVIHL